MFSRLVICALLAALLGCGTKPRVHKPGEEWLASVKLEGNASIDSDDLVPGLALRRTLAAGRALDPYQLTVDRDRLRAAYLKRGFFEATVTPRVELKSGAQHVVFVIVEGKRARLQVVIQGLPPEVPVAKARKLIPIKDGAAFDYDVYDAAKLPLVSMVENAGYPHVRMDAAVLADKARGVATARFAIEPGVRAAFGPISIAGTEGQLADAIANRLTFRSGDVYSAEALAESQSSIYELGRFSTVRIEPDRNAGDTVPVKVSVSLANRHELKLGGGLGYDPINLEVRGRAGGSYVSANYPLWTFSADLRPAITVEHDLSNPQEKIRALVSAHRLDMFRPRIRGELEVSADYLTIEAYTSKGPRFRAGVSAPLGAPWLQLRTGWLIEYIFFTQIEVLQPTRGQLGLDENQRRGAYELSLSADKRDNSLEPHRGIYGQLRATYGTRYAGGALDYIQLTPELRGYVPLPRNIVLAARARVGAIIGKVPVTERYFAGGANSHRGFPERRLAPTAPGIDGQVVIGGAGSVETGLELRIPLGNIGAPFGTELFLDGGDVVRTPKVLDPTNLHWAVGVGLWVKFFGLKLRGDVGFRLNRTGTGEPGAGENFAYHLGVGDAY
ncbi:MAG: BamA/TamA family outer membrane protein [Deltaproteobacteria bacterium]|nr:BamA/TamA family outer membrane protein [Deltaproteobacteria bacterium]